MSHNFWDYVSGGAEDEITLRRNRTAFDDIVVRPRFLANAGERDTTTTVLGESISFPVMAAPTAAQWLAHPDAEVAVAKAAGGAGTIMAVATGASKTVDEIAEAAMVPLWYQLYHRNDEVTQYVLKRAEKAGFSAVCLTIDGMGSGPNEREVRNDYLPGASRVWADLRQRPDLKGKVTADAGGRYTGLTWSRLAWLKSLTGMPLVVKGVLTVEDALLCIEHGVDGIVVSNHGGRAMDTSAASIEALPAIAEAVADRAEVYLDSGVRRGTDVLKALAFGARAVLIGRPLFWGLVLGGDEGVTTVFEILRREFERAMLFTGTASVDQITRDMVETP